jgi:PAS domain S-box-containing protein
MPGPGRDLRQPLTVAAIATAIVGAVAIDFLVLPLGARSEAATVPGALMAGLYLLALAVAYRLNHWRQIALVAIAVGVAFSLFPLYLLIEQSDLLEIVAGRRILRLGVIGILAAMLIQQKRMSQSLTQSNARLDAEVERRTHRFKDMAEVADGLVARLDALARVSFDGLVVTEDGVVIEVNEPFARTLGYTVEDFVGTRLLDHVAAPFQSAAAASLQGDAQTPYEVVLKRSEGSRIRMEVYSTSFADGRRNLRVNGFRDIGLRLALEREIVDIGERERRRIGYDLHDHLGQLLVSVHWAIDSLSRELVGCGSHLAGDADKIGALAHRCLEDTRHLAGRLAPRLTDDLQIYPALKTLALEVNRHTTLSCRFHCPPGARLHHRDTAIHLYRIAEEAVSNALKHSGGRNIDLSFDQRGDICSLEVLDDGIGIATESGRVDGIGLTSIHYRARLINGTVEIGRRAEGGTRLLCSFPLV